MDISWQLYLLGVTGPVLAGLALGWVSHVNKRLDLHDAEDKVAHQRLAALMQQVQDHITWCHKDDEQDKDGAP